MAKVITLSRVFLATHPKSGQQTHFVEKFLQSSANKRGSPLDMEQLKMLNQKKLSEGKLTEKHLSDFLSTLDFETIYKPKKHTIRGGNRWEAGQLFSPRVWSAKPYDSPQIIIAPDTEIPRVAKFEMDWSGEISIDKKFYQHLVELAENDGLTEREFDQWFKAKTYEGQIIIWDTSKLIY